MIARFVVPKEKDRAEVVVQNGPAGFEFKKKETYTIKYSFRAKEGMRVSNSNTRLGQLRGYSDGYELEGGPTFAIIASNDGINVRFDNQESDRIDEGLDNFLSWEDATGEWVHVEIKTTFRKSMEVYTICM